MPQNPNVSVLRTRHQGKDALYLLASDGTDLGWYDLEADSGHPGSELLSLVVDAAGAGWRSGSGSALLSGAAPMVSVSRWVHEGQNTLQVYAYDGTKLGVYDLTAERPEPASPYMDLVVVAAASAYQVGLKSAPRGPQKSNLHITHVKTLESDRLLVTSYDGVELGWYDLEQETAHPASEIMSLVIEAAGMAWLGSHRALTAVPEAPSCPTARLGSHLRSLVSVDPRWSFSVAEYEMQPGAFINVHVVTGPAGVFVIAPMDFEQAHVAVHNDQLWVDGSSRDSVSQARYCSERFSAHLSATLGTPVVARPVVAAFGTTKFSLPRQPDGLAVVQGDCIVSWLRQRREVIDDVVTLGLLQTITDSTWETLRAQAVVRRALAGTADAVHEHDEWGAPAHQVTGEMQTPAEELPALLLANNS